MDLNNRLRRRLKSLMQEHGLTEAGLARAAGLTQQAVNRFMIGRTVYPSLYFLDQLARVFAYTLADLLASELPQIALTADELRVLVQYRAMNPARRSAMMLLFDRPPHRKHSKR